ncbi:MAG: hypothetical protein E7338_01290 [Clostridiales bacterium]|nr:hypothetical protein [Clostridiales bacterium]
MSEETTMNNESVVVAELEANPGDPNGLSAEEQALLGKKYLKPRDYWLFSLARFASSAVTGLVQGYLLYFYTSCVGINAAAVGLMFLITKIFDGLNDPIMGAIVDKTRTKWGKMRPYLFFGAVPWGIITILMFLPQIYAGMNMTGKIVYMYVTYIAYGLLGTIIGVPLDGIPAVASPNTDERAKIISISRILGSIGEQSALVLLTAFLLFTHDDYSSSYMWMGIVIGILGPIFMLLGAMTIKERLEPTKQTPSVWEGFKYLFKNKQFMLLILSNLLTFFRNLVSAMILYVVSYVIGKGSLQIVFSLPGAVASMIGMMIAPKMRKMMDSKKLFIVATIWHSVALAVIFFISLAVGIENLPKTWGWVLLAGMMFVAMIPVGILNVIPHLMATDTLDYWEDKTGDRCEGITFSLMSLRSKISSGFKDYVLSFLLVFFMFAQPMGYIEGHKPIQTQFTKTGLIMIYTIVPAVTNLVSIIPILFYKLSGKKMAEIQARLEIKRAKDAAKLDENSNPVDTQASSEVEEAGMAVQVEAVNNDVTTAVESQIIAEATQEMVKEEEAISEEENKEENKE